jgi:hypothetical protein
MVSALEWSAHKDGWLAKTKRGYLFAFNRFDSEVGFKRRPLPPLAFQHAL